MDFTDDLKRRAEAHPKRIKVKVECIETGEIIKDFDCGTDFKRANRLEDSLILRTNLDKFHVYQSIEV